MDVHLISTSALRAFAFTGIAVAFVPALARTRMRFGVTFVIALAATAVLWSS
jgi:hypothetical protein